MSMLTTSLRRTFSSSMSASLHTAPRRVRAGLASEAPFSLFTQTAVQCMRKLYPEAYADKSFDNTGLLLEAPSRAQKRPKYTVLLTVDLTTAVANEAIARGDSLIISYHPIIFRPLKSLTSSDSQQQSLLKLAQEGISVYSPHTAVDASPGGLGDWLADVLVAHHDDDHDDDGGCVGDLDHTREVIAPVPGFEGVESVGMGKIIRFKEPRTIAFFMRRLLAGLRLPPRLPVAVPYKYRGHKDWKHNIAIRSIGICAGSGGSLLRGLDVDLLVTGELSHHEALAAIEEGKCVIAPFHSNTERQYLHDVMRPRLRQALIIKSRDRHPNTRLDERAGPYEEDEIEVSVSTMDEDPFHIYAYSESP